MEPTVTPKQFAEANALGLKASQVSGLKFNPINPTPINATTLGNTQSFKLSSPTTPTLASGLGGYISSLSTADSMGQELQKENQVALASATQDKKSLVARMSDFLSGRKGETTLTGEAYQDEGVDVAKKALGEVNVKITAIDTKANEEIKKIRENTVGANASAINQEIERVQREAATDKADLYLEKLVAQGDFDSAKEIADRKVAMQLEADQMQYDALKLAYDDNKEQFTLAEQRDYQLKLDNYKSKIDSQKEEKKAINEMAINAMKNGAPSNLVQQALKAETQADAFSLVGSYVDALDIKIKKAQLANLLDTGADAPIIKTINGVDMQWNPVTKTWDNIGNASENTKNSLDQIKFLRDTAKEAKRLSDASGVSGISKFVGDQLVGDTKFRQLEAQTNTLRTNVLTLMTDPSVKKYFGPQMSEADVRLMTAAGTTLNPENQSPAQLKTEIERLDKLFLRMQGAVEKGESSSADIQEVNGVRYRKESDGKYYPIK